MKGQKDMRTLPRRATDKVQFMNIDRLAPHHSHIVELLKADNHDVNCNEFDINQIRSLREKYTNTEFFLVRIFLDLD